MLLCMRTTIDMPDDLFRRAKAAIQMRGITFRTLVTDAVEKYLGEKPRRFVLREAAAGYRTRGSDTVSGSAVNRALDELREPRRSR